MQIVIRKASFLAGYGQESREFALSQFDLGVELVKKYESTIPEKMWVTVPGL
jgi:hypothetical protein